VLGHPSRHSNVRPATAYHWEEATAFSKHNVVIAPHLHDLIPLKPLHRSIDGMLLKIRDLVVHPLALLVVMRNYQADLILVRYFTTKSLLASAVVLWPVRKKLLFIIQNNLQLAHVGSRERLYFKLLCHMGFQFGFLEAADGLAELGVDFRERQFVIVPLPVYPKLARDAKERGAEPPTIGVIGRELPEKNTDQLMNLLVGWREGGDLSAGIVLGSNDSRVLEAWVAKGVTTVQTLDYQDYLRAIAGVDVLLIYYDKTHYFYRSSGVIHEAASVGTAVVGPDFPVFRYQVTQPVRVGAVFQSVEGMLPAIQSALEIARSEPGNFNTWAKARCPEEFSRRVDRFIEKRW
jgi:hypothetical protein